MTAEKPRTPTTLEEAKLYMESRTKQLEFLEYEVNQQSIACYKHFFVASCLDDVRSRAAEYRRAHVQVQGEATEMIRLDAYQKRQAKKSDKSN